MNERQAHEAILEHWEDGWEALHPADPEDPEHVPWTHTNELFESALEWVRISIVPALSRLSAFGAVKRWTREGVIGVQIFTRPTAGSARASELADDVRTVLEGAFILGVGDEPVVTHGGSSTNPMTDGGWFMQLVTIEYRFDELKPAPPEDDMPSTSSFSGQYVAVGGETSIGVVFPSARANANYNVIPSLGQPNANVEDTTVTPITDSFTTAGFTLEFGAPLEAGDVVMYLVENLS